MKIVDRVILSVRRLAGDPDRELTRWQRTARWWMELGRHGARELRHDRAGQMAAALTYHTLFSLLPMLVLMLVVMQALVSEADRDKFKDMLVSFVAPLQAEDQPSPEGVPPLDESIDVRPETEQADAIAAQARLQQVRETRAMWDKRIGDILADLEKVRFGSIGVVGLLIFIWGSTALLATVERSFNLIYNASRPRPWYMRLILYYFAITAGPIILLAGQGGQQWLLSSLRDGGWTNWLAGPMIIITPVLTTWMVLLALYVLLPHTKVHLRPAMIGSFVATVLWVMAIEGMTLYVKYVVFGTQGKLYGSLALLPLFLLWLWVTWLIVLFGLELTYILQAMKGRAFKHEAHDADRPFLDAATLIPVTAQIARAFDAGQTCTTTDLVTATDLPESAVQRILDVLIEAHIVNRVDDEEEHTFSLAKPADRIEIEYLIDVGTKLLPHSTGQTHDPAWQLVDDLRHGESTNGATTLADLAKLAGPAKA